MSLASDLEIAAMAGVAIVTGANRGIGFHIAKQLVESKRYAEVVIGCRDPVAGEQAANDIVRCIFYWNLKYHLLH